MDIYGGWKSLVLFVRLAKYAQIHRCTRIYDRQDEILATSQKGFIIFFYGVPRFLVIHTIVIVGFYIAIIKIPVIKGGRPLHMSSPSMPCEGDVPAEGFGLCNQSMQRSKRGTKSRHWYVAREVILLKYMLLYDYMTCINLTCIVSVDICTHAATDKQRCSNRKQFKLSHRQMVDPRVSIASFGCKFHQAMFL